MLFLRFAPKAESGLACAGLIVKLICVNGAQMDSSVGGLIFSLARLSGG